MQRDKLQVCSVCRGRLAIAVSGYIAHEAFPFEALDFSLQRLYFARVEKVGNGRVAFPLKLGNVLVV